MLCFTEFVIPLQGTLPVAEGRAYKGRIGRTGRKYYSHLLPVTFSGSEFCDHHGASTDTGMLGL